ncbi:hypothetical protein HDV04_004268 [Boothiomyces sp. JEL0838]|nr:hypothetical protein HDV04_004268 [Boothiomyces sp. JEL0838]
MISQDQFGVLCSCGLVLAGSVETFFVARYLLRVDVKSTMLYRVATLGFVSSLIFLFCDLIIIFSMTLALFNQIQGTVNLGNLLLAFQQISLSFKFLVVASIGYLILSRIRAFYGLKSKQVIFHIIFYSIVTLSNLTATVLTIYSFQTLQYPDLFVLNQFNLVPHHASFERIFIDGRFTKLIFNIYQISFLSEALLITAGTAIFYRTLANRSGLNTSETTKAITNDSTLILLFVVSGMAICKSLMTFVRLSSAYASIAADLVLFLSCAQYPLELYIFLVSTYETSRDIVNSPKKITDDVAPITDIIAQEYFESDSPATL